MLQSKLFTKTRRESPKDEIAKNADLLIRAGYIYKEMAGVYSFLPLGLMVLNNIVSIIRKEMNDIGGQEVFLSALQDRSVWELSGRWSDEVVDNWFKTQVRNAGEAGLGFTHEEPLTRIMKDNISSWKDLPRSVYQFQTKFRNEARAKSGIMRGREFLMKDLYTFSKDNAEHELLYEEVKKAYIRIFDKLGIGGETYVTFAGGGSFSQFSHEFQTISDAGEDIIYVDKSKRIAINKEVLNDEVLKSLSLNRDELIEMKAIEVGNIFTLGTRFSEAIGLHYNDESGISKPVYMGSYGIGPSRVMGVIAELHSDEKGLIWPENISPFKYHLVYIKDKEGKIYNEAKKLYETLIQKGYSVLFDDRDLSAGEKFNDSDLMGITTRIVISEKTLNDGNKVEIKDRRTGTVEMKDISSL
jgi:prolyl-tRNA synthetase